MADREVKTPASRKRSLAGASTQAKTKRGRKLSTSRKGKAISTSKKKRSDFFDLAALPENVLLRIFVKAGYKTRLSAMQVCKRFHNIATHPRFTRRVKDGKIMETVKQAKAGDTIVISPGLYDEMVLFEKPVKVIGEMSEQLSGGKRNGVVLQSSRSICVLCNARCAFENIVFRTGIATTDRSVCSFGPQCEYMRFDNCEFGGFNGLYLPRSAVDNARLTLFNCRIHGVAAPLCGVSVEKGVLRMEGCTITNCQYGVDSHLESMVYLRNNEISFNEFAMLLSGRGVVCDNLFWGNVKRSAVELSIDNMAEVNTDDAEVVPTFEEALQNFKQAVRESPPEDNAADPAPPAEEGAAQAAVEAGADPEAQNQAQAAPPADGEGDAAALLPEQQLLRHAVRALRNPLDRQRMEAMRRHIENNDDINWMDNPLGAQMEAEARDLPKRIHVVGNQLKFAGLKRERSAEEAAVRRRVRQLAAMTYGAHEHGWHDAHIADSDDDWTDEDDMDFDGDDDDEDSNEEDDDFGDVPLLGAQAGDFEDDDDDDDTDSDELEDINELEWDEDVGGWGDDSDLDDDSEGGMHTDDDLSSLEDALDVAQPEDLPQPEDDGDDNDN